MAKQTVTVTGLQEQIDALTVFQRSRLSGSIRWSLEQFGFILRENEQQVIQKTFNNKNAFTIGAPLFTKPSRGNSKLVFFLRDNAPGGNSPDRYLEPQVSGGEVYVTRFTRALRRTGAVNLREYVLHWGNPAYKPTPGLISAITSALTSNVGPLRSAAQYKRNLRAQEKYYILGKEERKESHRATLSPRKFVDNGYKGPGIYTRKGGKNDLIYRILQQPVQVPAKYDWSIERMQSLADQHLPELLLGKLAEF